jgi:hypothetical protein
MLRELTEATDAIKVFVQVADRAAQRDAEGRVAAIA